MYDSLIRKLKKIASEHKAQYGGATEESEVIADAAAVIAALSANQPACAAPNKRRTRHSVSRNGITVSIQKWENKKLPVLAVEFDGENCAYKVASFNSDKTARWFSEIMDEFFKEESHGAEN